MNDTRPDGVHAEEPGEAASAQAAEGSWRRPRRWMPWIVLLMVLGAAAGGALGWTSGVPEYESVGLVRFVAPVPRSPSSAPDSASSWENWVGWIVAVLESPRVSQDALESEVWRQQTREEGDPDALAAFERRRTIIHAPGTQHIAIRFRDPDPKVAEAGAAALVEAYMSLVQEALPSGHPRDSFYKQLHSCEAEQAAVQDRLQELTEAYGGMEGLRLAITGLVQQRLTLEMEIRTLRARLENVKDPEMREGLETRLQERKAVLASLEMELAKLGRTVSGAEDLSQNIAALARDIERLRLLLERSEQGLASEPRITVFPPGPTPQTPALDPRPVLALRGALGGAAAAFLLVLVALWIRAFFPRAAPLAG